MDDESRFEPALARARRLRALLDPGSGAAEGERANAAAALDRLLTRHGWTLEVLGDQERRQVVQWCAGREECRLVAQLARWVADEAEGLRVRAVSRTVATWTKKNRKGRMVKELGVAAWLTGAELLDWAAAQAHYVPLFREQEKALKARVREASKALKMAVTGFVNRFDLFPSNEPADGKPLSEKELEALRAAMREARGERWKKGVPKLGDGTMALGTGTTDGH